MSLVVLQPGLASRVVDLGRPRTRSLGVPVGGAADVLSFTIGNALAGNPPDAAALEVCWQGPVLRAEADLGCGVAGAPFTIAIGRRKGQTGTTFTLRAGEELHIGAPAAGMRAYLCVRGGMQTPTILGSRSGLAHLKAGDVLPCATGQLPARSLDVQAWQELRGAATRRPNHIRVVAGLQADWFAAPEFYDQDFTVTKDLDRMGIRLAGQPLTLPERELVSEPVCPGAVQVTSDGQCIILGVDGQTIGGYPKIAQVIHADLDLLGQLRPGDRLRFELMTLQEALLLQRQSQAVLQNWLTRLRISLAGIA